MQEPATLLRLAGAGQPALAHLHLHQLSAERSSVKRHRNATVGMFSAARNFRRRKQRISLLLMTSSMNHVRRPQRQQARSAKQWSADRHLAVFVL